MEQPDNPQSKDAAQALAMAADLAASLEQQTFAVHSRIQELKREVEHYEKLHSWLNGRRHQAIRLRDALNG